MGRRMKIILMVLAAILVIRGCNTLSGSDSGGSVSSNGNLSDSRLSSMLNEARACYNRLYSDQEKSGDREKARKNLEILTYDYQYGNASDLLYKLNCMETLPTMDWASAVSQMDLLCDGAVMDDTFRRWLLQHADGMWMFLDGKWQVEGREYSFTYRATADWSSRVRYRMPGAESVGSGTYVIHDNLLYMEKSNSQIHPLLYITVRDMDHIDMYCYYNESTYSLYRVQE